MGGVDDSALPLDRGGTTGLHLRERPVRARSSPTVAERELRMRVPLSTAARRQGLGAEVPQAMHEGSFGPAERRWYVLVSQARARA